MGYKNRKLISSVQSVPIKLRVYKFIRAIFVWFLFGALVNLLLSYAYSTPKTHVLNHENNVLLAKIDAVNGELREIELDVDYLDFRYKNVYKALYGLPDVVGYEIKHKIAPYKYDFIRNDRFGQSIEQIFEKKDLLSQELVTLSFAMDSIYSLAMNQELMLESIPILSPIHKDNLGYISDRFGFRMHPIKKRQIMHKGLDMACLINTPVYAPANGVVKSVSSSSGYGKLLVVDHGFGYITKYAHLNSFKVMKGDKIKRGEIIALSGNTGTSTGAHLHYEVIFNKKNVDPMNYISLDMTVKEFTRIAESAKTNTEKSYDNLQEEDDSSDLIIQ